MLLIDFVKNEIKKRAQHCVHDNDIKLVVAKAMSWITLSYKISLVS